MQPWAVASQIFYWTNYYIIFYGGEHLVPFTSVNWSLAIEEHFYFIFPLIFMLAIRQLSYRNTAFLFFTLCLLVLIWRYWLILEGGMSHDYTYYATDTRFDSLLFGCIMGVWKNPVADDVWKLSNNAIYTILCLALVVLFFVLFGAMRFFEKRCDTLFRELRCFQFFGWRYGTLIG
ncbi:MAG: acyltransferase [Nitrosomonas sp.]|nr:acyltransferase [Nitrosomonas sp.]